MRLNCILSLPTYLNNMAIKFYTTRIAIELTPSAGIPDIDLRINDVVLHSGLLTATTTLVGSYELPAGSYSLSITHRNKSTTDPTTAVVIKSITFNDISRPKFVWSGVYTPEYPELWCAQKQAEGHTLDKELTSVDHLGWNGTWRLAFTAPIFTWIHEVENLGQIYR